MTTTGRLLACAILFLAALPARATTVIPLTPEEVDARASRIFVGTCLLARPSVVPGTELATTEYEFAVEQVIKSDCGETNASDCFSVRTEVVVFRQVGRARGEQGPTGIVGLPSYRVGGRYRLALHADSVLGLTSPVGLWQGVVDFDAPAGPSHAHAPRSDRP